MNLQNGHLSEWMTQGGKELMVGRRRGMLERPEFRDALDQSHYSELS
jgi:hypothetical protein